VAASKPWPDVDYSGWSATCDTLHAHTQVLGKIAAALAPPEPDFLHIALRHTARGWETAPLPAPDGSGPLVVALDLRTHEAVAETGTGGPHRVALTPDRPVGEVTRELLAAIAGLAGAVEIDPEPQEVSWTVPLDEDAEHFTYDAGRVVRYQAAAGQAALMLSSFRAAAGAPSTPVCAWWGSFDLAVSLSLEARELAVGWWPGDGRYEKAAFYAYARPAPEGFPEAELDPPEARWDPGLGEYLLDWDDAIASSDPSGRALAFARSALRAATAG
jgi:hypothetical protein